MPAPLLLVSHLALPYAMRAERTSFFLFSRSAAPVPGVRGRQYWYRVHAHRIRPPPPPHPAAALPHSFPCSLSCFACASLLFFPNASFPFFSFSCLLLPYTHTHIHRQPRFLLSFPPPALSLFFCFYVCSPLPFSGMCSRFTFLFPSFARGLFPRSPPSPTLFARYTSSSLPLSRFFFFVPFPPSLLIPSDWDDDGIYIYYLIVYSSPSSSFSLATCPPPPLSVCHSLSTLTGRPSSLHHPLPTSPLHTHYIYIYMCTAYASTH